MHLFVSTGPRSWHPTPRAMRTEFLAPVDVEIRVLRGAFPRSLLCAPRAPVHLRGTPFPVEFWCARLIHFRSRPHLAHARLTSSTV